MDSLNQSSANLEKREHEAGLLPSQADESGQPSLSDDRVLDYSLLSQRRALESSLESLFPSSEEESQLQKARAMLGEIAQTIPDDELAVYLTQFQYLLDEWLDDYEESIFDGLTLRKLLQERR